MDLSFGFQRGTHTRWQLAANTGIGAPTLTDKGGHTIARGSNKRPRN